MIVPQVSDFGCVKVEWVPCLFFEAVAPHEPGHAEMSSGPLKATATQWSDLST